MTNEKSELIGAIVDSLKQNAETTISSYSSYSEDTPHGVQNTQFKPLTNMKIDKNKVQFVIGIDLGHGETSASSCPIQWDVPADQQENATPIDMDGDKKVMPSAITILEDGTAHVGKEAFNSDRLKDAQVHVCFKKAPEEINGEPEKLMIRYMKEVYKTIRKNYDGLTDDNHVVYIATPSGWNDKQQSLYVDMAKEAQIPIAGVTKESRAAFICAQRNVSSGLSRKVSKGAIVFDMGSSTLDFTFMKQEDGKEMEVIDHGYDCGASAIEKIILKDNEQKHEIVRLFEERYPDLEDALLFQMRQAKEDAYNTPSFKKHKIDFDDIVEGDDDFDDESIKVKFEPNGEEGLRGSSGLNEILRLNGYIQSVKDAMLDFKHNHIHEQQIYGVFMTGGASRMDFLKPLICECWNVPEDDIYRDQDPSLTISNGVAEVARLDILTSGQDKNLEQMIVITN